MKRVFADTHFFIALLSERDEAHQRAIELQQEAVSPRDEAPASSRACLRSSASTVRQQKRRVTPAAVRYEAGASARGEGMQARDPGGIDAGGSPRGEGRPTHQLRVFACPDTRQPKL